MVLRGILTDIKQNNYFSLIVDETTDVRTKEQLRFCIRYVDANLQIKKDFISMCETHKTDARIIAIFTRNALIRCDLRMKYCRSQRYDSAGGSIERRCRLQIQLKAKGSYVHCTADCLNHAVQASIHKITCTRDMRN